MMKIHLSSGGRVVVPRQVRDRFHLEKGMELQIGIEGDRLMLTKARSSGDWRSWQGKFKGVNLTRALKKEDRAEEVRDRHLLEMPSSSSA